MKARRFFYYGHKDHIKYDQNQTTGRFKDIANENRGSPTIEWCNFNV